MYVASRSAVDTVIIGAGPYGLSIASHLKHLGVSFRIFGSPMKAWLDMPKGIALKSTDFATGIYTPQPNYSLIEYCRARGISTQQPMDMSVFTQYGLWAQKELVPEVEDIAVCRVTESEKSFAVTLDTAELITARRVVVAVGLGYFKQVPSNLEGLPRNLVSHTSDHQEYSDFAGKDVVVIGRGTSAIEAAGLLKECGANVSILVRSSSILFGDKPPESRSMWQRINYPDTVVGPGKKNWVLQQLGTLAHYIPEGKRLHAFKTYYGPFCTWWMRDAVEGKVAIHVNTKLVGGSVRDGRVVLDTLENGVGKKLEADHVVAGTGYTFAVDRIPFLAPTLLSKIDRIEVAPRLSINFESSVKGLYFVGPISAYSFGPLVRFVCGAEFTAPKVARHLAKAGKDN